MSQIIRFGIHRLFLIFILLSTTVGCDQLTKAVARNTLSSSSPIGYFHNSLVLEHAENPGAFMNLGASLHEGLRFWIFTFAVSIFLLGMLFILLRQNRMSKWVTIGITLVIGGGFGNLIDRMDRGTVTDFINLGIGSLRTGIFNVADMAVVTGALLLILVSCKTKKPTPSSFP